jgi:hypothetical protein
MSPKEQELIDTMASVRRILCAAPSLTRDNTAAAWLAMLQGQVLALRVERGDVSALDEAAANADAFQSIGVAGIASGLCPACGCEFTAECQTCNRYLKGYGKAVEHDGDSL